MKNLKHLVFESNYYYSRLLQELAFHTGGPFGRPSSVIALLTNRCNASCVHCRSWELPHINSEMTTDEWKKTFHELRRWLGPAFVSVTGGETLLKRDAIEIVEYAARFGFWIEYLTNGYLLDDTKASRLAQSGAKRIKISLDGSHQEIHDKVRGREGFFMNASRALKTLAIEKEKRNQDIQIWGKTTIMSINVADLPNIVTFAKEMKIDGVEFQALEPVYYSEQLRDQDWYKDNPLWINDPDILSKSIRELKNMKIAGYPIINTLENLDLIESYFRDVKTHSFNIHSHEYNKKKAGCRSWIGGLQIMPDGGMKMCHWMKPFANAKNGYIHKAWKNRAQCWKSPCPYIVKTC